MSNAGPSTATNVVVNDPTPSGLTFVSNSGALYVAVPVHLGSLAPGASQTITTTLLVPPGYTTPNPIVADRQRVESDSRPGPRATIQRPRRRRSTRTPTWR